MKQLFNSLRVYTAISVILLSTTACSTMLFAEEVKTSCFKIIIPSRMSVEWNKRDTILAVPVDSKLKVPFLQISYIRSMNSTDQFDIEVEKAKILFNSISNEKSGKYIIVKGEREDSSEGREIYTYLAIIKGLNIGVIMIYLSHEKQEGDKSQFNNLVAQIIESNKEMCQPF